MAKKFLENLADSFEDDALTDIIPGSRRSTEPAPKRHVSSGRKHKLRSSLGDKLEELPNAPKTKQLKRTKRTKASKKRKSFLEAMEEAYEENAFDDIIPKQRRPYSNATISPKEVEVLETRFSTTITTDILNLARRIAIIKNVRIKDVINRALERYIEEEKKSINF